MTDIDAWLCLSSFYLCLSLPHTETVTALCIVSLTNSRSNLNWCTSLVVPQFPALPSVNDRVHCKYCILIMGASKKKKKKMHAAPITYSSSLHHSEAFPCGKAVGCTLRFLCFFLFLPYCHSLSFPLFFLKSCPSLMSGTFDFPVFLQTCHF